VLLVGTDWVPVATAAELTRLAPAKITILGGTGAVSAAVAQALADYAPTVVRIGGADRYATASLLSAAAFPKATRVLLATGTNFADALSGSPVAAGIPGSVLLSLPSCMPSVTSAEIDRLTATRITLLGGTGALSSAVQARTVCS